MAKILLVEDDRLNRQMIARRLTWEGHQVITAEDGALGVAMAQSEQPDIILMDMGLPILNGWQATHRLKMAATTRTIPIIALTAYALNEDRVTSIESGCDDYEPKPVDFASLQAKIQVLLNRSGTRGKT